ncbi:MAG: DNA starvation/stationary phase protection protein [Gammaproteobacteria bacterium]|nr:DNA starvation/stationary phase protection protein [Gammaproteobacteria bacterium]
MSRTSTAKSATTVLDVKSPTFNPNIGVTKGDRKKLAGKLSNALADTYMLYLKTQGFHWNVAGPMFYSLHKLTEAQYEDMFAAIDELAERIRALGEPAPASFKQFLSLTRIDEETGVPTAEEMICQLVQDNDACAKSLREAVAVAEEADDVKTADLLTDRIGQHEQNGWMLRAMLAQ